MTSKAKEGGLIERGEIISLLLLDKRVFIKRGLIRHFTVYKNFIQYVEIYSNAKNARPPDRFTELTAIADSLQDEFFAPDLLKRCVLGIRAFIFQHPDSRVLFDILTRR